jgi:hypothetical protein
MFSNMNSCKNTRWRKPYVYLLGAALLYLIFRRLARGAEATGRRSLGSHLLEKIFDVVNRVVPWHKLPTWLAAVNLISFRDVLREKNLHDTSPPTKRALPNTTCDPRSVYARRSDGTCNDLEHPEMGAAGERFGRNVPREYTFPEKEPALLSPSPRVISQRLLARESFRPAHSLNLLAAAWIQFQTHDWFAHHRATKLGENDFQIPLDPNDNWPSGAPMRIPRTPSDPTRQPEESGTPPTYINEESHWWDGSQIYGDDPETTASLRDQGKLKIEGKDHLLPIDPQFANQSAATNSMITQQHIDGNTPMGANLTADGATFRVWAPGARAVYLNGLLGGKDLWKKDQDPGLFLTKDGAGYWSGFCPGAREGDSYKYFVVGGGSTGYKRDPFARELSVDPPFPHSNCILRDPALYPWHDGAFVTPDFSNMIVYQAHVGTFYSKVPGEGGTFLDVVEKIEYLAALAINVLQLLPIDEFETQTSLGYNGSDIFSPEMRYGVSDQGRLGEHKNLGASSPTELKKPFGSVIHGDTIGLRCRSPRRYAFTSSRWFCVAFAR